MSTVTLEPLIVCVGRAAPIQLVGVDEYRSPLIPANASLAGPPAGIRPPVVSPSGTDDDPAAAAASCWTFRIAASAAAARANETCACAAAPAACWAAAVAACCAAAVSATTAPLESRLRPSPEPPATSSASRLTLPSSAVSRARRSPLGRTLGRTIFGRTGAFSVQARVQTAPHGQSRQAERPDSEKRPGRPQSRAAFTGYLLSIVCQIRIALRCYGYVIALPVENPSLLGLNKPLAPLGGEPGLLERIDLRFRRRRLNDKGRNHDRRPRWRESARRLRGIDRRGRFGGDPIDHFP